MLRSMFSAVLPAVLIATMGAQGAPAAPQRGPAEYESLAREILRELIEINANINDPVFAERAVAAFRSIVN